MDSITIEELEKLNPAKITIVDIRPRDHYVRGTFPGAINIPSENFSDEKCDLPKENPVYLLCHTVERSREYTRLLQEEGLYRTRIPHRKHERDTAG